MGILGILNNGFLGLIAQEKSVGAISHNIANARTEGYKDQHIAFSTLVGAGTTSATYVSRSPVFGGVAAGVRAEVVHNAHKQGAIRQTGETSNMAIMGDGWFTVREAPTATATAAGAAAAAELSPADLRYTRTGNFFVNKDGKLQNANGKLLLGRPIAEGEAAALDGGVLTDVQIPVNENGTFQSHAKATTKATLVGALSNDTPISADGPTLAGTHRTTLEIYDTLGRGYQATLGFAKTAEVVEDGAVATTWSVYLTGLTANQTGLPVPGSGLDARDPLTWAPVGTVNFLNGSLVASSGGVVEDPAAAAAAAAAGREAPTRLALQLDLSGFDITQPLAPEAEDDAAAADDDEDAVAIPSPFVREEDPDGATAAWGNGGLIVFDIGAEGEEDGLREDLAGNASHTELLTQDGFRRSGFERVDISETGVVRAIYQSGASETIFQVAVARFRHPGGLAPESGTVYAETAASGAPEYGFPDRDADGRPDSGTRILAEAVEESTVDITDQFTRLIQAQRIYSANAKTMSTADELWQIVNQLKS